MLNEIQAAYEYMYDLEGEQYAFRRLKWGTFSHNNDLDGLIGMMTFIARYFIFENENDLVQGRRRAEAALKMWLGFTEELDTDCRLSGQYAYLKENYPWLEDWLSKYLKHDICNDPKGSSLRYDEIIKKVKSNQKKEQFESKSLTKERKVSDYKVVRYDRILANAQVSGGPLKRYYLVCEYDDWKRGTNKITKKTKDASIKQKDEDKVYKLVAAYLLERNRKEKANDDFVFEAINWADISFWAAGGGMLGSHKYNKVFTFEDGETHERRPLFNFYTHKSKSLVKVKPDLEWMAYCGWDIIEATDNDNLLEEYLEKHPGAIYFSDPGASQKLKKNQRYTR